MKQMRHWSSMRMLCLGSSEPYNAMRYIRQAGGTPRPTGRSPWQRRTAMIRKLKSGEYRLYSRKVDPKTGRRRNLGTFDSRAAAERHEREVQYFKRH
jgi:hypothetical protein